MSKNRFIRVKLLNSGNIKYLYVRAKDVEEVEDHGEYYKIFLKGDRSLTLDNTTDLTQLLNL